MPVLRRVRVAAAVTALAGSSLLGSPLASAATPATGCGPGPVLRYVVLFDPATPKRDAEDDIQAHCGSMSTYYLPIGVAIADSSDPAFADRIGPLRAYSAEKELRDRGLARASGSEALPTPAVSAGQPWNMAAIRADHAHQVTEGSHDVGVAVLDSGVDPSHPELAGALDRGRSASCLSGAPKKGPQAWAPPGSSHGTHVAGIIAAADDGRGVTGVAPASRLTSIRVIDDAGYVHPEYAVCGFMWAAESGVRVANSSFLVESAQQGCGEGGSPVPREALRRAVNYATSRGVLTVAALGNDRLDLSPTHGQKRSQCDAVPSELDGVLTVSAIGKNGLKSGYSSYGLGTVDIAAPGGDTGPGEECVLSTVPGGYGTACGTSMAAPHVAGIAALAAAKHPQAQPAELARLLTERSTPMSCPTDYDLNADSTQDALCRGYAAYNGFYGHGMADALAAVTD